MEKAHKYVNQFINDTILEEDEPFVGLYGVISETFIYPDEVDEDVAEATVEGESYDIDSIKFSIVKFRNSKIEENFIKT